MPYIPLGIKIEVPVKIMCIVRSRYSDFSARESFQETSKSAYIKVTKSLAQNHEFTISKNVENLLMAFNFINTDQQMVEFLLKFDIFTDIKKPSSSPLHNCNDSLQCFGKGVCKLYLNH